jgi:hypothetical protein
VFNLSLVVRLIYNQEAFDVYGRTAVARTSISAPSKDLAVNRFPLLAIAVVLVWIVGCNGSPGPVEEVARRTSTAAPSEPEIMPPEQDEPALDENSEGETASRPAEGSPDAADSAAPQPLNLEESGISFVVPAGWKRVTPPNRIIEAEFELARAAGDEYDGRLTLMSSGGDPQEVIATRTAEFKIEPGESVGNEKIRVGDFEASLVDLRGEWKGSSFQPVPPRADYRMLLFVLPFSERSGFYAKLTGPRTTIAAHEGEFREFLRSAKITRDRGK